MANTKVPAELSSTPSIVDNGNSTALTIDSDENIGFNTTGIAAGSTSSSQNSTATPKKIVINNDYSSGYTDASLKLYLFNSGTTRQGFTSGPAYDLQYHSSGHATGRHAFYVGNTESARIDADGIKFNGDSAAANALDDYEEGTWNPTLVAEAGSSGQSYDRQYGYYTRVGDFVFLSFDVRVTNVGTSGAGQVLTLGNHGFTFTGNNTGGMGLCGWFNLPNLGTNQVNFYANGSHIYCMEGSTTYIDVANHLTTNSRLIGGFCGQINR